MTLIEEIARAMAPNGVYPDHPDMWNEQAQAALSVILQRLEKPSPELVDYIGGELAKPRMRVSHMRSDKNGDAMIALRALATHLGGGK